MRYSAAEKQKGKKGMERIIYSKCSDDRKEAYAVRTELVLREDDLLVRRSAWKDQGVPHVRHIYEGLEKWEKSCKGKTFRFPSCTAQNASVEIEYIEGDTVEEKLNQFLEAGEKEKILSAVRKIFEEIETDFDTTAFSVTEEFEEVFGKAPLPDGLKACSVTGMELLFQNLVADEDDRMTISDAEWIFSFPIPLHFVFYRCIHHYLARNDREGAAGLDCLYELSGIDGEELETYRQMERSFARWMGKGEAGKELLPAQTPEGKCELRSVAEEIAGLKGQIREYEDALKISEQNVQLNYSVSLKLRRKRDDLERQLEQANTYAASLRREMDSNLLFRIRRLKERVFRKMNLGTGQGGEKGQQKVTTEVVFESIPFSADTGASIAVHLHLYYRDLLEEMLGYIDRIPFAFDLYISCQKGEDVEEISDLSKERLRNVSTVTVRECENRGRDIAPMYILFGDDLAKHDYLLHIHTKKSFHMSGAESVDWRRYSLESILGSEDNVKRILTLLQEKRVGLVYPELFDEFGWQMLSWLANQNYGWKVLEEYGIHDFFEIFQYPAGSFFWAKTDALRPIFDRHYKLEDFDAEAGQIDGTLAHVMERLITAVALEQGYVGAIIDLAENRARYRISRKLFWEYHKLNLPDMKAFIPSFDCTSFDLMGTLVTTKLYWESDLYAYMRVKDESLPEDFPLRRRQAEKECFTLEEIYRQLGEIYGWDDEAQKKYRDLEFSLLLEIVVPRNEMVELYTYLQELGRTVILATDTVYSEEQIRQLLAKCNMKNPDVMQLSSKCRMRKDEKRFYTTLWDDFEGKSIVHLGDDPYRDWNILCQIERQNVGEMLLMSPQDLFYVSDSYDMYLEKRRDNWDIETSLKLGKFVNCEEFNSPFAALEGHGFLDLEG